MFYLLFQYKESKAKKFYIEFKSKGELTKFIEEELVKFIKENDENINVTKIIESEKEYKMIWLLNLIEIGEDEKKQKLICKKCGEKLSNVNTSGYCIKCEPGSRIDRSKRRCSDCGTKIAEWNKSGKCTKCRVASTVKEESAKRREKRKVKRLIEKENKMGKCRKCNKDFELEDWQHSSMHWCSECRKLDDYKNFSETQHVGKI